MSREQGGGAGQGLLEGPAAASHLTRCFTLSGHVSGAAASMDSTEPREHRGLECPGTLRVHTQRFSVVLSPSGTSLKAEAAGLWGVA